MFNRISQAQMAHSHAHIDSQHGTSMFKGHGDFALSQVVFSSLLHNQPVHLQSRAGFEFKWTWSWERARVTRDYQIVNHFSNFEEITTKDGLHRNLARLASSGVAVSQFYPRTYSACDMRQFLLDYSAIAKRSSAMEQAPAFPDLVPEFGLSNRMQSIDGTRNMWIVKPSQAARGVGIHVFDKKEDILAHLSGSPCDAFVIQKYIENPLLPGGKKFDIRQFVLVVSLQPLIAYVYNDFYLRFCTVPYNSSNIADRFVHLTNHQVQKESNSYHSSGVHENQWSRAEFIAYLGAQYGEDVWKSLELKIHRLVGTALKAWPSEGK